MKITKSVIPVIYVFLANTSWILARIPASFRIGKFSTPRSTYMSDNITALKSKRVLVISKKIIFLAKNEVALFKRNSSWKTAHLRYIHSIASLCYSTLSRSNDDKSVDFKKKFLSTLLTYISTGTVGLLLLDLLLVRREGWGMGVKISTYLTILINWTQWAKFCS